MVTDLMNINRETIRKILKKEKLQFYQEQVVGEKAKVFIAELWTRDDNAYMEEIKEREEQAKSRLS